MNDYMRESLSYFGLYKKMFQVKKKYQPVSVSYDRQNGEPAALMSKNDIPMLLIQSRHDGLIPYACAEDMKRKAEEVGNSCELYSVTDRKNTHSWYTAGMFLETREENKGLDKFFSWIEEL